MLIVDIDSGLLDSIPNDYSAFLFIIRGDALKDSKKSSVSTILPDLSNLLNALSSLPRSNFERLVPKFETMLYFL